MNPRPTDFTYTGSNPFLKSIISTGAWTTGGGTPVFHWMVRDGRDPHNINGIPSGKVWAEHEIAAVEAALAAWAAVINVSFVQTSDPREAEFVYWLGTRAEVGALGWQMLPIANGFVPLYGAFAHDGRGWTPEGLQPGGFGFNTLLHELGHGLGLAHPHDTGGGSTILPGVTATFWSYGEHNLNQGVFTVMGYNHGYPQRFPYHNDNTFGWVATPTALDIAAAQAIYGPNMRHATGNDLYRLPSTNGPGTFWACIWDAGGRDTISAEGANIPFTIDLRAATLTGPNAGGYVSSGNGVIGGRTIAHGVVIEDAIGGESADHIIGNDVANVLHGMGGLDTIEGGAGDDTIFGGNGSDLLFGGDGDDFIFGGRGGDTIDGGAGFDVVVLGMEPIRMVLDLQSPAQSIGEPVGDVYLGIEAFSGGAGADQLRGDGGPNRFMGGGGSDRLYGRAGDDTLDGGAGADVLYGNTGADSLTGGPGNVRDRFVYFGTADSGVGPGRRDVITDYQPGIDRIEISRIDANPFAPGNQAFTFLGTGGFSGRPGELRTELDRAGGRTIVQADIDGDGRPDFEIELTGLHTLTAADFLL